MNLYQKADFLKAFKIATYRKRILHQNQFGCQTFMPKRQNEYKLLQNNNTKCP